MRYELTQDLVTGNAIVDGEHRQLFDAANALMDACTQGQGREQVLRTKAFLNEYVKRHFSSEEQLQKKYGYPGYQAHKNFHDNYCCQLESATALLEQQGATVKTLGDFNHVVGILMGHIRTEDKKMAGHISRQA